MIVRNASILLNAQESNPLAIPDGYYLARVVIPAAFDSNEMKLKVSVNDGSTHQPSFVGTEFMQAVAAGNSYSLDTRPTKGASSVILDFNVNETAARSIPCVFERF